MNSGFSLSKAFNDGLAAFRENALVAIGGLVVYMGVSGAINLVPILGPIASLVIAGPLTGGLALFTMKLAGGAQPKIGDIFSGFERFAHFLLIYLLWILIGLVCALPLIIFLIPAFVINPDEPNVVLIGVGTLLTAIVGIVVGLRLCFSYYVAANRADGGSVKQAFAESARITKGHLPGLFLAWLAFAVINILGALALFIGLLFTIPLTAIAFASIYLQLQDSADAA